MMAKSSKGLAEKSLLGCLGKEIEELQIVRRAVALALVIALCLGVIALLGI